MRRVLSLGALAACAVALFWAVVPAAGDEWQGESAVSGEADFSSLAGRDIEVSGLNGNDLTVGSAMEMVSQATGWPIVCTEKAGRMRFGMWARGMKASDVIKSIVKGQGIACRIDDKTLYIMDRDEYNQAYGGEKLVLHFQHVPVTRAVAALKELTAGDKAKVASFEESGAIVVYDTPANLAVLKQLAAEIDKPLMDVVIQLENVSAPDLMATLQPLRSPVGVIAANETTNQIVISDIAGRAEVLERLCRGLDKASQRETRRFALCNADCATVAGYLADMFGLRASASGAPALPAMAQEPQPAQPAPAPAEMQGGQPAGQPQPIAGTGARAGQQGARQPNGNGGPAQAPPQPQVQPAPMAMPAQQASPSLARASSAAGQATVVADTRTNCVWVTETPDRLEQIAEVIEGLDTPSVTAVYEFKYANPMAEEFALEERCARILRSEFDHYEIDPVTRRVTVTACAERAAQAVALFEAWDVQPRQVFITGKALSVRRQLLRDLGVTFDALISDFDDDIGTAIRATGVFPPAIPPIPRGSLRIGDLADDNFTLLIEALETDSSTKVLSSPRVMVMDGVLAELTVATEEPYTEIAYVGEAQTTVENVRFKNVGVTLQVTPRISGLERVGMEIMLQVGSLIDIRNGVPVVANNSMQSIVMVDNGAPLVIGGLISDQTTHVANRVPILGNIPLLGILFRNTHSNRDQRELVLVVVPTIVGTRPTRPEPTLGEIERRVKAERAGVPESVLRETGDALAPAAEYR